MATAMNHELLVATEASGQQWSVGVWDLHTGSSVRTCKGQAVKARCLCLHSGHTVVGAADGKPLLQLWPLGKMDENQQKIVCPGTVSALATSPDGLFCVASIGEKIYIWEMTAGNLVGLLSNFDEVLKIQFTDDGSHFVVGTVGGMVKIWNFANAVSSGLGASRRTPRRVITAHVQDMTDMHVGSGGPAARVVTASEDHTCKLWDMISGNLIRTVVFEKTASAVIMDTPENYLIAGLKSGLILCCPLYGQISQTELFVSKDATNAGEFVLGEDCGPSTEGEITCLALSSDCRHLVSGSRDGNVRVWNLEQRSCSTSIPLSDVVGNVMVVPPIAQIPTAVHHRPPISFKQQTASMEDGRGMTFNVTISDTSELPVPDFSADIAKMLRLDSTLERRKEDSEEPMDTTDKISALEREIAYLKQLNKDLTQQAAAPDKDKSTT
ncbi:WD repeat-containing protein 18-like isoform X2 [Babylonia areolata]|uniref:WD repeat-containing protein 18-like isoform X2 n=1 Tax=Babylonia areolata TaxID=304850 RepID=UPI003FCFACFD